MLAINNGVDAKIVMLREAYGSIERIDPSNEGYKALVQFLNKQPVDTLVAFERAKIKWVSGLARTRINRIKFALKNLTEMPV